MSAYYTTDSWVLRSYPWGEADRLLACYSKELGRIDLVAKGVRKSHAKLKGHVGLFAHARLHVASGAEYWKLLDAELIDPDSVPNKALAEEFSRFLLKLIPERERNDALWQAVNLLGALDSPERLAALKVRSLLALGLLPGKGELKNFFTPRAARFIAGEGDASFLRIPEEATRFHGGIDKILSLNHVV